MRRPHGKERKRGHLKDSCVGKLHYPTVEQAQLEIDRAATYRGETLRAYACTKCGKFHLTSQEKRNG